MFGSSEIMKSICDIIALAYINTFTRGLYAHKDVKTTACRVLFSMLDTSLDGISIGDDHVYPLKSKLVSQAI